MFSSYMSKCMFTHPVACNGIAKKVDEIVIFMYFISMSSTVCIQFHTRTTMETIRELDITRKTILKSSVVQSKLICLQKSLFLFRLKPFSWLLKSAKCVASLLIWWYSGRNVYKTNWNVNKNYLPKLTMWNAQYRKLWEERTTTPNSGHPLPYPRQDINTL